MADENAAAANKEEDGEFKLRSVHTTSMPQLLEQLGITLLISTYQAGKVIIARPDGGKLNTHFRSFNTPMGMCLDNGRLAIGTKVTVHEMVNQPDVAVKLKPEGKHDACYMPRSSHYSGNIGIHEIAYVNKELWVVNTRFSCLSTFASDSSFVPRWRPKFVTKIASEDRCHLNAFGLREGRLKYATALGMTDTNAGWRANKARGGVLMDIPSNEIISQGLSMPHSPRWHGDRLWVLESGGGTISVVDEGNGRLEHVCLLPGFTRGVDFAGPYAFIGLSQVRESAVFSGIPITERLPKPEDRSCGVWAVDLRNGQVVAFLRFEEGVQEIFSVLVLPHRFPDLLTEEDDKDDYIANSFMLPDEVMSEVVTTPVTPDEDPSKSAETTAE